MVEEFIGVCGQSGVGKKTLVEAIRDNKDGLRQRFGIPEDAALDTFGAGFGPLDDKTTTADYLIWKWQKNNHSFVESLPRLFPDAEHRLIVIWLPLDMHHKRMLGSKKERHRKEAKRRTPKLLEDSFRKQYPTWFRDDPFVKERYASVELVDGSTPLYDPANWPD